MSDLRRKLCLASVERLALSTMVAWGSPVRVTCRRCCRTSYYHEDVLRLYCGGCHAFDAERRELEFRRAVAYEHAPGLHVEAHAFFRLGVGLEPKDWGRPKLRSQILCAQGAHRNQRFEAVIPTPDWVACEWGVPEIAQGIRDLWLAQGFGLYRFHEDAPETHFLTVYQECQRCGTIWPADSITTRPPFTGRDAL